jgi:hypothetical protein
MATWQYDIYLVPRDAQMKVDDIFHRTDDGCEIDTSPWWSHYDKNHALAEALSRILPASRSWTPDIQTWGDDDGDRIDLMRSGDAIDEVYIRIDARHINNNFLSQIAALAREFDLIGVTEDQCIIELTFEVLSLKLRTSPAFRFVSDPRKFLDNLSKPS